MYNYYIQGGKLTLLHGGGDKYSQYPNVWYGIMYGK